MHDSDRAWLALAAGVAAYDLIATDNERLSDAARRYFKSQPVATASIILMTGLHLIGGLPHVVRPVRAVVCHISTATAAAALTARRSTSEGAAGQVRLHRREHRGHRADSARPRTRHRPARHHPRNLRNRRSPSEGNERVKLALPDRNLGLDCHRRRPHWPPAARPAGDKEGGDGDGAGSVSNPVLWDSRFRSCLTRYGRVQSQDSVQILLPRRVRQ